MMLLRSSSTPALNSLIGIQTNSDLNSLRSIQLTQLHVVGNGYGKWGHDDVQPRIGRTLSEADLHSPLSSNGSPSRPGLKRGFCSSDLCRQSAGDPHEESPEKIMAAIGTYEDEGRYVSTRKIEDLMGGWVCEGRTGVVGSKTEIDSVNGGSGAEDGGGRGFGGRGGGFGSDSHNTDAYYKKMLQADPSNPLLLTNYARFLQEVQHDLEKAEEYYGRAILASPGDGDILSLYANLIWDVHNDAPRAESYFVQAVEVAPDDCNVLGSYAHFLWHAEDDEEDEDASQQQKMARPTCFGTATTAITWSHQRPNNNLV